jgi:hypothetical protein
VNSWSLFDEVVMFFYFSFTTLSTVGFGDYHPKTSLERLIMAAIMVFGVSLFSYTLGEIVTMMEDLKKLFVVSFH